MVGSRPAQGAQSSCFPTTELMGEAVAVEDPGVPEHQRLPGVAQQFLTAGSQREGAMGLIGGQLGWGDPFQGDVGVLCCGKHL